MDFKMLKTSNGTIAELTAADQVIISVQDAVDLLGNLYYQAYDKVILHEKNIAPAFFDLKTGIAGEILQKFSNYRIRLAIVGDFSKYESKSLKDFIFESNKMKQVSFASSVEEACDMLGN